jgi:hypothetical protein
LSPNKPPARDHYKLTYKNKRIYKGRLAEQDWPDQMRNSGSSGIAVVDASPTGNPNDPKFDKNHLQ